jgi:ribosomal protein S18 acetylase RimI-like enzyme
MRSAAAGVEGPASIAALELGDHREAADVLARAFRDNPLNVAVIGNANPERRVRSNLHGMRSLLPVAEIHGRALAARSGGRVVGALISTPPGAFPLPPPALPARIRCLLGQGLRVAVRWGRVFDILQAHRSPERSWYLGTLGVDPGFQGRGVGSALVATWLEAVDRDRSLAFLETDTASNVRVYGRAGFEVVEEVAVFGAVVWRMRRRGRKAAISTRSDPQ